MIDWRCNCFTNIISQTKWHSIAKFVCSIYSVRTANVWFVDSLIVTLYRSSATLCCVTIAVFQEYGSQIISQIALHCTSFEVQPIQGNRHWDEMICNYMNIQNFGKHYILFVLQLRLISFALNWWFLRVYFSRGIWNLHMLAFTNEDVVWHTCKMWFYYCCNISKAYSFNMYVVLLTYR